MNNVHYLSETNPILRATIEISVELLLQSVLGPEKAIDEELAMIREAMLQCFYGRFPGAKPNANS